MTHFKLLYVLVILGFATPALAIQDVDIRPKEPTTARVPPKVTKSRKARVATNGVLFVLTVPLTASITVKNNQGSEVKRETIEDGEFRAELAAGAYDIDIAAAGYYPVTKKGILVKPPQAKIERVDLKPTTGLITIGLGQIEPATAAILIDDRNPADLNIRVRIKKEENQIELDNVAEGFHTLSISHPSIAPYKRDRLEVRGGSITFLTPGLKPAVVNFIVKSEPGAAISIDGNYEGRTQENGVLKVSKNYSPGTHTIKAEIEDKFEPNEKTDNFAIGEQTVVLMLTRVVSSPDITVPFNRPDFLQTYWDAPPSWQLVSGKLVVKGAGPGLLRDRRYADFRMVFDITFINGRGASWIVRARDKQNYYLFQLGGPAGAAPRTFNSYIFQNGQLKSLDSVQIVEDLSRPDDQYLIKIEANGSVIKHFIQLKSEPASGYQPLHTLPNASLLYGTVGFQAKDNEEFNVLTTIVIPNKTNPPATR